VASSSVTLPELIVEPYGMVEGGEEGQERAEAEHIAVLSDLLKKSSQKIQIG
jgi:hypothetical protein